jgi:DNA-binding IclR family transcriptional regulator
MTSVDQGRAVRVVERALDVLECVADSGRPLNLTEISRRTALSKATTHRLLTALRGGGLLDRGDDGYTVGRQITQWALAVTVAERLHDRLMPVLVALLARTTGAVGVAVRAGDVVQYSPTLHDWSCRPCPPERESVHDSASGLVLLAHDTGADSAECRAVRRRGFAYRRDRDDPERAEIAVAVLAADGRAVAALRVVGDHRRLSTANIVAQVRRSARMASVLLDDGMG